MIDDLEIKT